MTDIGKETSLRATESKPGQEHPSIRGIFVLELNKELVFTEDLENSNTEVVLEMTSLKD